MRTDKQKKDILKDALRGQDTGENIAEKLHDGGEEKLADFLSRLWRVKKTLEPSEKTFLKILETVAATKDGDSRSVLEEGKGRFSKISLQLHMPRMMKIAIPVTVALIIAVVVLLNPFREESGQVSELKHIADEERLALDADSDITAFLAEEKEIQEALATLNEFSLTRASVDLFGMADIDKEVGAIDSGSDLTEFLSEEESLREIDAVLAGF